MKKIYEILKTIIWINIGVFVGNSICEYSYRTHYPDIFIAQSAPWYTSILVHSIITIVITIFIAIIMFVIKKKMK